MKTGRVFWGVFFIIMGGVLLCSRFCLLAPFWADMWKFWPLVFILWGFAILFRSSKVRWILIAIMAVVAVLLVASAVHNGRVMFSRHAAWNWGENTMQTNSEQYDSTIACATLEIDAGAGSFTLNDTSDALVSARTETSFGRYEFATDKHDSAERVAIRQKPLESGWHFGGGKNTMNLRLNMRPLWNMDFDLGAAAVDADLSPYRIGTATFNVGASSLKVKLGARADSSRLVIGAGASSLKLSVPANAGCELVVDAPLSGKDIPGFAETGEHTFRTANYDSAAKRIFVHIEAGVSSISVERYEPTN